MIAPSTLYQQAQAAQVAETQRKVTAAMLQEAKLSLRAEVRAADDLFTSSAGKATDPSRRALAVVRNQASTAILLSASPVETAALAPSLVAARELVKAEVAAWEAAEAARKAEEARIAEEQRRAHAAASHKRGGARSSGGGGGGSDPKAYLEGIAAAYGGSISWSDHPCGRGGGTKVSGCYQGGGTIYVSNSALASMATAKGKGRNVVLHELSHMLIQWKCGTVLLGGSRFENVTDAYAILLGASATTGYGYNDNDMALASAALGGTCLEG